jgi:hypothetical protein
LAAVIEDVHEAFPDLFDVTAVGLACDVCHNVVSCEVSAQVPVL